MHIYHNLVGFPPAPSAPVHFAMIDEKMVDTLIGKRWVFEYPHRLANEPHNAYKVIEGLKAARVNNPSEAQS